MATLYATDAQNYLDAQTIGDHKYFRQALDCMIYKESYTVVGTEAANDIIKLSREFPAGTVIIPILSKVHVVSDPGTALNLDIGFNAVDDFADNTDLSAVGVIQPTEQEIVITTAVQPQATVITATSLTADAVIDFYFAVRQTS